MALYSVHYVESLEARISNLQHGATLAAPGMSLDQPIGGPHGHLGDQQITDTNGASNPRSGPDLLELSFMAPLENSNNVVYGLDMLQPDENLFSISDMDVANHDANANTVARSDPAVPIHGLGLGSAPTFEEVSVREGAVYFQVYFEVIHPRYPFLDVEECSRGYQDWRMSGFFPSSTDAWESYLVKMARETLILLLPAERLI